MKEESDSDEIFFSVKDTFVIILEFSHNKKIFDLIEGSFEDELLANLNVFLLFLVLFPNNHQHFRKYFIKIKLTGDHMMCFFVCKCIK